MIGGRGGRAANLEVITIDLICEACGTSNPPGTEFCTNCNSYLAWDRSVLAKPPPGSRSKSTPPAIQPGAPNSTEGMDGPIDTTGRAAAAGGYPNAAPADQGYPNQGYADAGYGDQGYYNPGYDQGAYYQGGAGYAPTLEQPALYRHELPELRHDQSGYSPLLRPLRLRILLRRVRTRTPATAPRGCQPGGAGSGRAQGVPALAATALPLAAGDHRRAGGGAAHRRWRAAPQ